MALTGFVTTAVTFGPARSAFGLFVPQFRDAFGLSTGTVGLLAALGYAGFLGGLVAAMRFGRERVAIIAGAIAAAVGLGVVTVAQGAATLALGVVVASSSAGLTWSTFNGVVNKTVRIDRGDRTLSLVSTGTASGLAATGAVALTVVAVGALSWRPAWLVLALAGVVAVILAVWVLPATPDEHTNTYSHVELRRAVARRGAPALLLAGAVAGIANSAWLSFAVDLVVAEGGVEGLGTRHVGPVMFIVLGVVGLGALTTSWLIARWGIHATLRCALVLTAASLVVVASAPSAVSVVLASAAAQGLGIMVASACFAALSLRLHGDRPVYGFTAVLLAVAVGNIVGAAATGLAGDYVGLRPTFVVGGATLTVVGVGVTLRRWYVEHDAGA